MGPITNIEFNPVTYLSTPGSGRQIVLCKPKQAFYTQGSAADSVFYIKSGRARLTVVSKGGKEATVTLWRPGTLWARSRLSEQTRFAKPRLPQARPASP